MSRAGRPRGLRGDGRGGRLRGGGPPRPRARRSRPARDLPRVPVPGGDPGGQQRVLPQGGGQRGAPGARRRRAGRDRLHAAHAREGQARGHGRGAAPPAAQRGLLRRREEAQRDPPDDAPRPAPRDPRRDRLGPRHRRPQDRGGRGQRAPQPRPGLRRRHPPRAIPRVRRPRSRARAVRGEDRAVGRPHPRPGARGAGATGTCARSASRDLRGPGALPAGVERGARLAAGRWCRLGRPGAAPSSRPLLRTRFPHPARRRLEVHERAPARAPGPSASTRRAAAGRRGAPSRPYAGRGSRGSRPPPDSSS